MSLPLSTYDGAAAMTRVFAAAAVSGLWQGVVLATAAAFGLRLAPRSSATVRFFVWIAVLAGVAVLPFVHLARGGAVADGHALRLGAGWSLGIAGVWAAISFWRLGQLAAQGVRLRRIWREARGIETDAATDAVLRSLAFRRVELCVSEDEEVDRPSVIGFFAPRILIPAWLLGQMTAAELRQIVLHEVEHLRRGDDWLNLVQKLSLAVFPLNPALVWIEQRLCSERELACDDGVLRVTASPTAYASCLTTLAEKGLARRTVSLALGALGSFARQSELSRRVYGILYRQPGLSPARSRAVAAVLVLGLAGAGAELARSPELISFAGPAVSGLADAQGSAADRVLGVDAQTKARSGYRDVMFSDGQATPRMTLLKAVMPTAPGVSGDATSTRHAGKVPVKWSGAEGVAHRSVVRSSAMGFAAGIEQPVKRLPVPMTVAAVASGPLDDAATAQQSGSWIVLTSFQWNDGGQSATVLRSARFVRDGAQPDWSQQDGSQQAAASADAGRAVDVQGVGASARKVAQPRQVLVRYAAVPTDLGWLIVQL